MASNDGQSLIADFRDRQRAGFIATMMDWLTTGVNIPCARNIVFFRYLRSPILFRQIVGRGTGKKPRLMPLLALCRQLESDLRQKNRALGFVFTTPIFYSRARSTTLASPSESVRPAIAST